MTGVAIEANNLVITTLYNFDDLMGYIRNNETAYVAYSFNDEALIKLRHIKFPCKQGVGIAIINLNCCLDKLELDHIKQNDIVFARYMKGIPLSILDDNPFLEYMEILKNFHYENFILCYDHPSSDGYEKYLEMCAKVKSSEPACCIL